MAISNIVKYESSFDYELLHPVNGTGLKIWFTLVSSASDSVKSVIRRQIDANYERQRKGKSLKASDGEVQIIDRIAACFQSWKWNGQEFRDGQGVPEFTRENILDVLSVDWIFDQVNKQVNDIENFTGS